MSSPCTSISLCNHCCGVHWLHNQLVNSADPHETAPAGAVSSGFSLFTVSNLLQLTILCIAVLIDHTESGLVCQYDSSVPDPTQVRTVARCGPHEICSMEQYITPTGSLRHNLRCKDRLQCSGVSSNVNTVICSECCDKDLCAASLCKHRGLPSGNVCFHCDYPVTTPLSCEHIKICGADEACGINQLPTKQYEVKCRPKASCASTAIQSHQCTACCGVNLCNDACGLSNSPTACVDDSICQGLKQNFQSNGRDVCQDPAFKSFCNDTCGLCPKTTPVSTMIVTSPTTMKTTPPTTVMTPLATNANPCIPNPCQHGICSLLSSTAYVCTCTLGYIGTNCNTVDPCHHNNPCKHGHCSLTTTGSAQCTCLVGYSGAHCDTVQSCHPNPCIHGACSSQPGSSSFSCTCDPGYSGTNCDTAQPCHSNPCLHGTCSSQPGSSSYTCTCDPGYSGTNCDAAQPCHSNPCLHGTCSSHLGSSSYICTCDPGYSGTNCDAVQPCHSNPCVHGICSSHLGSSSYTCTCDPGYGGTNCDAAQACHSNPCLHGTCSSQPGSSSYSCACDPGYSGTNCDAVQPCHSNPCVHGSCSSHIGSSSYTCTCDPGYSGTNCDAAQACHSSPCLHGTCSSHLGSSSYTCTCDPGYSGTNCDAASSPCLSNPCTNGQCSNLGSSYHCLCNIGFTGTRCDIKLRDCKDVFDNRIPSPTGDEIFTVKIGQKNENVRCDMITDGGGWTIMMNRETPTMNFTKDSTDYALGFGSVRGDFWIGLEDMHDLTSDGRKYQLRVELLRANGQKYYEVYDDFSIGPRPEFILHVGKASGTAGDSLRHHDGYGFTTVDVDRDSNKLSNCADYLQGAWWFYDCYDSCLTCPYVTPGSTQCRSMSWNGINYCEALRASRMLVKPM